MNATTASTVVPACARADATGPQHGLVRSAALHLLPGVAITIVYAAFGPLLFAARIPPEVAVMVTFVAVLAPLAVWRLRRAQARGETPIAYGGRLTRRQAWIVVPLMVVWSFLAWGLAGPVDAAIDVALLGRLPEWFGGMSGNLDGWAPAGLWAALVLAVVVNGLIAPVVEEVWFRGHLLPRLGRYGAWAPVINTLLFATYHFWQPMHLTKITLAMLPWIYLTWRLERLRLAVAVHVAINLIGAAATVLAVVSA